MKLDPTFISFWLSLSEGPRNLSKRAAHRYLILRWHAWLVSEAEPIPGYERIPMAELGSGIPRGWSLRNLERESNRIVGLLAKTFCKPDPRSKSAIENRQSKIK